MKLKYEVTGTMLAHGYALPWYYGMRRMCWGRDIAEFWVFPINYILNIWDRAVIWYFRHRDCKITKFEEKIYERGLANGRTAGYYEGYHEGFQTRQLELDKKINDYEFMLKQKIESRQS